jgi:ADP-ribose pyrophosphatase YjhB (NUDIX family)
LDEAVVREVKEETWLDLIQFEKYSFTGHTSQNTRSINHLYIGKTKWVLIPETEAKRYSYDEIKWLEIAFNQTEIIEKLHNDWML